MAVNKYPFVKNLSGEKPLIFPGLVQAGSTAEIKRGEICTYDETTGYWIPVNAVADRRYSLAIANEEQKSDGLARYMEFMALRPDDVFEFILDAVVQIALGDGLELTASDSQKLTRDVDGDAVAFVVGVSNYPEVGTTLRSIASAEVVFNPVYSYYMMRVLKNNLRKIIESAASMTPKIEDCGAIIVTSAAQTITLPSGIVPIGWNIKVFVGSAHAVVIDPKPDTASLVVAGAVQTAGKTMSMTDESDYAELTWNGTNWLVTGGISGAEADITIEG